MAIKNWDYHSLYMDFSSMFDGNDHPSDIDMMYIGKDDFLILGEIKNEKGILQLGQRHLLEDLIKGWHKDGMILYITHNQYWQHGAKSVDVSECQVKEIFYKAYGKWTLPKRETKVREIIEYYRRHGGR